MKVLLTGGAGFIGSHTAVALAAIGHQLRIVDDFSNSERSIGDRLAAITGRPIDIIEGDITDLAAMRAALKGMDAVIHFAAKKAVGESVERPLDYHATNVGGLLTLLRAMRDEGVHRMVFSSSATVYGDPQYCPIDETHPLRAINPYGSTKLIGELILSDLANSPASPWSVMLLRYFNPVGAHESGLIGEMPQGKPNNLMPLVLEAATGKRDLLQIFGTDYDTPDGTAIRDYIHVMDLAEGHVAALDAQPAQGVHAVNLGTGRGTSVRELVAKFEEVNGVHVPSIDAPRRAGDAQAMFAAVDRARDLLGWEARRDLAAMCADSWRFAKQG